MVFFLNKLSLSKCPLVRYLEWDITAGMWKISPTSSFTMLQRLCVHTQVDLHPFRYNVFTHGMTYCIGQILMAFAPLTYCTTHAITPSIIITNDWPCGLVATFPFYESLIE